MIGDDKVHMWLCPPVAGQPGRIDFRRIDPRTGRRGQTRLVSLTEATTFVVFVSLTTGDPCLSTQLQALLAIAARCRRN